MYSKSELQSQLKSLVLDEIHIEQAIKELNSQDEKLVYAKKDLDDIVDDNDRKVKGQMANKYKTTEKRTIDNHYKAFLKEIIENISELERCLDRVKMQQNTIRAKINDLPAADDKNEGAYAR